MTTPRTLRALQQTTLDGPRGLRLAEVPVPTPGPGEILIRVAAAGVNFVDLARGRGTFGDHLQPPFNAGFERADPELLVEVLRADATLEATPFGDWQAGRTRCIALLATYVLGAPGTWRMVPTAANGQPAAIVYRDGVEDGIVVLEATATGIARVVAFHHGLGRAP